MAWLRRASLRWIFFCLHRMCDVAPVVPLLVFSIIDGRRSSFPFPVPSFAPFVVVCFVGSGISSSLLPLPLQMSISNEDDSPCPSSSSSRGRIRPPMFHFSMGLSSTMWVGVSCRSHLVDGMCPCIILLPPYVGLFLSRSSS
jgi:hypothetical protein